MSSRNLVICDSEPAYGSALASFLNGKRELAFQVKTCSCPEKIEEAAGQNRPDILLIAEEFWESSREYREQDPAVKAICLTSEREEERDRKKTSVFKYQSGEDLCSDLMRILAREEKKDLLRIRRKGRGRILGFYSPVHRTGQTAMALETGRKLAAKENVLYLNLETFAGIGGYFPEEKSKDMSVLLYYTKQQTRKVTAVLADLVRNMEGMDYVPPVRVPEDIREVSCQEWLWLFGEISGTSIYDTLILDLGDSVQGLYQILEACDELYVPKSDDPAAVSKLRQFEEALIQAGCRRAAERMVQCDGRRASAGESAGRTRSVQRNRRRRTEGTDFPGT